MVDSSQNTSEDVRSVFDSLKQPCEPLTTGDVAQRLDCSHEAAFDALEQLAAEGLLGSKQMGPSTRAWWRPQQATDQPAVEECDSSELQSSHSPESSLFERIFEVSPISIAVFDVAGEISIANERAESLLGLEPAESEDRQYRQPEWELYHDDGTPVERQNHPIARVFETGEPSFGFEHWLAVSGEPERWVWGNAVPVLGDDESVDHVVAGFVDATTLKERENKLTSETCRVLELSSEQLFEPYLTAGEKPFRVAVDEVVTLPNDTTLQYITATGMSAKTLTEIVQREDAVRNVRLLRSTDNSCSIEVEVTPPTVPFVFDDFGGAVISLVENQPDEAPTLVAELPGDVDPRTTIASVRKLYPDVELDSQELRYSPRLLYDIVEAELTDRKFAVLQTAYFAGYFETPRKSDGDELAERLGITRQTFNQHLRKAEEVVFEQLFEASGKGNTD